MSRLVPHRNRDQLHAAPDAPPMKADGRDDAVLVAAVLAGDSAAFGSIYDRYADRIHDYAFSMLRQPSDAADVMQDTVDIMGASPLSANLRFAEGGATTPFEADPVRPGRFSVTVKLGEASVTPQVVARSDAATSRAELIVKQLERCVVID